MLKRLNRVISMLEIINQKIDNFEERRRRENDLRRIITEIPDIAEDIREEKRKIYEEIEGEIVRYKFRIEGGKWYIP